MSRARRPEGLDTLIPIGRPAAQREMIIGASQTGKTAWRIDTI